jgi:predicted RNA-binding Zn-ribbon protein involved in translation (DUF1610 family)
MAKSGSDEPKVACGRCGQTWRDGDLRKQGTVEVCPVCFDEPEYKKVDE